jgi:hypothetical protein
MYSLSGLDIHLFFLTSTQLCAGDLVLAVRDGFSRDLIVDLTRGYDHIRGVGLSTSARMHLYRPSTRERTMAVGGADLHGRSHSKVSESGAVLDLDHSRVSSKGFLLPICARDLFLAAVRRLVVRPLLSSTWSS